MIEEIGKIVQLQKQLAKQAVKEYSVLVDHIIFSKSNDQNHIEHTLDGILDFCFDDNMLVVFKKLCRYYYYINPEATEFYVNEYKELWDNDSKDNEGLEL
jgi:hypothetical protein